MGGTLWGKYTIPQRRRYLFGRQHGKCYFCKCRMVLPEDCPGYGPRMKIYPNNMATIEHLRDRFDPTRQEPNKSIKDGPADRRWAVSCRKCNNLRAKLREATTIPKEELWARSGSYPQGHPLARPQMTQDHS